MTGKLNARSLERVEKLEGPARWHRWSFEFVLHTLRHEYYFLRQVVADWLSADYLLYNHFLARWMVFKLLSVFFPCRHERNVAKMSKLQEKISELKELGQDLEAACEGEKKTTEEYCRPFFRKEREYTRILQTRNRRLVMEMGTDP